MKILYRILSGIFYVLGAVTVSFILYLNMTKSALIALTYAEQVQFQTNTLLFYFVFAASCVLLVGSAYLAYRDRTSFLAQNGLLLFFLIGAVLYLIAGLFLIFKVPVSLRTDAEVMYSTALLVKIIPNVRFIFLMNLLLILFNNLLILNITDALFHHDMRIDFCHPALFPDAAPLIPMHLQLWNHSRADCSPALFPGFYPVRAGRKCA